MRTITYLRVSTTRQGQSGLGLEAQREAVKAFLAGKGWPPVAEFVEVESGKRNDRPQLQKALEACRIYRAKLVIAKLDRLSRNAAFLLTLRDSGVEFVACDIPDANTLTVGVMALLAQYERELIAKRTKEALAQAKARGTTLGGFRGYVPSAEDRQKAAAAKTQASRRRAAELAPVLAEIRQGGVTGARGIARALNDRGVPAARGGAWQAVQVQRLLVATKMSSGC